MKKPLGIPSEYLQSTIAQQFGIRVKQLEFIPIGESSWLYKATDIDGKFLAVKVQREDNPAVNEARRLLTLSQYAYAPETYMAESGKAQANMGGLYVSIEDYIEHNDVKVHDSTPDQKYLQTLGRALRSLHDVEVPQSDSDGSIPVETFRSLYLAPAQETLANFMDWSAGKPQVERIKDVLINKSDAIQSLFDRSIELGTKLLKNPPKLILTHGDVHFGNTLETDDGHFYIIDWDSTIIGGAGHDLMYFSDAQLAEISIGYGSDLLADQDNLQYYRNHLMLRATWFWLNKAMSATSNENIQSLTETVLTIFNDSDYMLRALGRDITN